jgi:hypothetical protein
MANYCCTMRSNYFAVKSLTDFDKFCERWDLENLGDDRSDGLVGLTPRGECLTSMPRDEDGEELNGDFDFAQELSKQLADEAVAIWMEVGNEKLRYVCGFAWAINSKGKMRSVGIDDIYKKARQLTKRPEDITDCSY